MHDKRTNLILPMAGHGQRFRDAGYAAEKPLIEVNGRTLLRWALDSLPPNLFRLVGVVRSDQLDLHRLAVLDDVVVIPGSTHGAACSVLAAALALPQDEPVAAMNCDQWFDCDLEDVMGRARQECWDGAILTFPGKGPQWSYAITNGPTGDRVLHVIEKAEVSPHATVGFYWWWCAADLVRSISAMIANDQRTKGEFYLAPSYNFLPLSSRDVRIVPVRTFVGLGTPEQLDAARSTPCLVREP